MEKFKNIPIYPEFEDVLKFSKDFTLDTYPKKYGNENKGIFEAKPVIKKENFIFSVHGEIFESINKIGNGGFAYEEPSTKARTWFSIPDTSAKSIENVLESHSAVIHEVIKGECRYFCDLDDKTNKLDKLDFEKLINTLQLDFGEFFVYFYRDTGKFDNKDYAINCFRAVSNANYNSAHLIFDIIDKTTNYSFGMKCPSQQGPFWISFMAYLDKKYDLKYFSEVLDTAIYRYNTQLRVVGAASPKPENAPGYGILQPIYGDYYRLKIPHETSIKIQKQEILVQLSHFEAKIKYGYSYEDFLVVPHFKVPRQFLDYINEAGINKPTFYTEYEKLRFAEILKTSTLDINPFSKWRKAHYRIFCFYHFLPLEQRKRVVREFFASRGWDKPMNLYENDVLCDEWITKKWHHNYKIDVLEKKFKVQKPLTKDFCADEINYPQMNPGDNKIICMRSGTKTGKSYNFIKQFKDARTLCITYRRSLAYELVRNAASQGIEYINYRTFKYEKDTPAPQHFVCQLESLFKFADIIDSYDVVFIDESEALVGQFNHVLNTNPRAIPQLQYIFELIMNEKNVIFASANLAERTTNFIKDFKKDFEFLNNTKKDKVGWSYERIKEVPAFMKKIKELAAAGKKLIIPTNISLTLMPEISKILSEYGKVLTISADGKEGDKDDFDFEENVDGDDVEKKMNVDDWINYDFVIHSPVIEAGINFLPKHFDHICGLFFTGKNTYDSCYQMLFRAREPLSQKMYIYAEPGKRLKRDDLENEKEIDHRIQIKENKTKKFEERYAFNNSSFVYGKYMHPVYKAIKRHELFSKYSDTYFDNLLFKELENSGVALDGVTNNSEGYFMTEGKELRAIYNDKMAAKIVNQDTGTAQEYGFKLDEIGFPIDWETIGLFSRMKVENKKDSTKSTYEIITNLIQKVRNYLGIVKKITHFFNKEQDIIFKLTNKIKPGQDYEQKDFEKLLDEFMTENYNVWTATFEKRKCTLKDMLKKKFHYKLQSINPQLERCYFKMYQNNGKYVLNCINMVFVDEVLNIIEKQKLK